MEWLIVGCFICRSYIFIPEDRHNHRHHATSSSASSTVSVLTARTTAVAVSPTNTDCL